MSCLNQEEAKMASNKGRREERENSLLCCHAEVVAVGEDEMTKRDIIEVKRALY